MSRFGGGGSITDWYSSLGADYAYLWALPGTDGNGFHGHRLPPSNIIPVGEQVWDGFHWMMYEFSEKYNLEYTGLDDDLYSNEEMK